MEKLGWNREFTGNSPGISRIHLESLGISKKSCIYIVLKYSEWKVERGEKVKNVPQGGRHEPEALKYGHLEK